MDLYFTINALIATTLLIFNASSASILRDKLFRRTKATFTCPSNAQGFVGDPNSCTKYYFCAPGTSVDFTCSAGLAFNQRAGYCDFASNVPGCAPSSTTTTTTTTQSTTTTKPTTTTTTTMMIPTTPTQRPVTAAHVTTAAQTTRAVYTQTASYSPTPNVGTHTGSPFSPNPFGTKTSTPWTYMPLQTMSPTRMPISVPSTHPPPSTAPTFVPPFFIFGNTKSSTTNAPTSAAPVFVAPTTVAPPVVLTSGPSTNNFCMNKPDGLYSDPANCGQFYQCSFSQTYISPCPSGLVFNQPVQVCDYPANVPQCASYLSGRAIKT